MECMYGSISSLLVRNGYQNIFNVLSTSLNWTHQFNSIHQHTEVSNENLRNRLKDIL